MTFPGAELWFALQINVPGIEEPFVNAGIDGTDGHIQFGMIYCNLVRGLSLLYQWSDNLILLSKPMLCNRNARLGVTEQLTVSAVYEFGIAGIFVGNGVVGELPATSIADIRSLIEPGTPLFFKVPAGLITGGAGSTLDTTDKNLVTDIEPAAGISVEAEVPGIIKIAFVIPV